MDELLNNYHNSEKEVSNSLGEIFENSANETDLDAIDSNFVNSGNLDQDTRNNLVINMDSTNLKLIKEADCTKGIPQSIHLGKQSESIITVLKKKRLAVIESDSECEESTKNDKILPSKEEISNTLNSIELIPDTSTNSQKKVIDKWSALCDSDSSDTETAQTEVENKINKITENIEEDQNDISILKTHKSRIKIRLNSDTENEQQDESQYKEEETYTLGSKGELVLEKSNNPVKKSTWAALCDSDSSEDEVTRDTGAEINQMSGDEDQDGSIKPTPYKRKPRHKSAKDEPKKMTGKDALKLRKEIQSESQRMLRETKVSLPYHKPKQFTLKEFLSRRPKLSSAVALPSKLPPSLAIKMPKEQLEVISKKLAEREKEVKEFYKSDSGGSDNDDAGDPEYLPEIETQPDKLNNTMQDETENKENQKEENENDVVMTAKNYDEEGSGEGVSNKNSDMEDKITTESNIVNNLYDEITDVGINNQIEHAHVYENVKNKSENQKGSLNLNVDLQVAGNILEKEQSEKVIEFDSGIEISIIGNEVIPEDAETECSTVIETQEDKIPSGIMKKSSISEVLNPEDVETEGHILSCKIPKSGIPKVASRFSDDYEFNLDDLEESEALKVPFKIKESEETNIGTVQGASITSDNDILNAEAHKNVFENDDLDKEIEAFNVESTEVKKDVKISELLKEKLGNIMPRLSGTPDDVIDLECGIAKPKEIVTLMKRFEKHTAKKQVHKSKVQLNIVSVLSQGNIEKETVSMDIDDENSLEVEEKPGARLQRLRNELQNQIAKKKSQMWQSKSSNCTEKTTDEEKNEDEFPKPDYEDTVDDIVDDEDEEDMSESSEEDEIDSEEDEKEEYSKKKERSIFIDEEAEESDIEDEDIENDESNDSSKQNGRVEKFKINENSNSMNESEKEEVIEPVRKPLKRIKKGFTEDSDEESDIVGPVNTEKEERDDKVNEDDDMIPPHQIMSTQTPVKVNSQQTQNSFGFDFLTPVSYITGIKNLTNSAAKSAKDSPAKSPFPLLNNPNLPSPLKETDWQASLQRKLFVDSEMPDSQTIANVCSGEFPLTQSMIQLDDKQDSENQQQNLVNNFSENSELFPSSVPSTQDLLNICSGKFTGTTQLNENSVEKESSATENDGNTHETSQFDKRKISDIDDVIISQLLDEEEMEKFKKKFDSPIFSDSQKEVEEDNRAVDEVIVSGILDSDDEDEEMKIIRRKNKTKLTFSDDESSEESVDQKEEEIDLHDVDDEDEIEDTPEPNNVEYDSEENEIELEKDGDEEGTATLKASDFFDEEAELSESEWGSADEDEKDLDTFEMEMGDTEKYDEKQLRTDLEKIHMRRMLDEDQREVKLLQELYLEDGELHGSGRQRQFKWKNIDTFNGEDPLKAAEDDVFLDEEESEEQWRKKRYLREQFLKEKQKTLKSNESSDLLSNSQIVKIGHKVLQRSTTSNVSLPNTPNENEGEIVTRTVMSSLIFSNKRGSFLSRGEDVLQKIAEFNKVTDTVVSGATAKNSRRFLFQTVSVEGSSSTVQKDKKRKASDGTPNVIKKLRLSDNLSPANRKKKLIEPKAKAKLF